MRAIAELASSVIAGFGGVAAQATGVPATDMPIAALANKPARSATLLGFMRSPLAETPVRYRG